MNSVDIFAIISSVFGIIGSLLTIIIFLHFKEQKLFYRKLILVLSFYDLLQSISYILPGKINIYVCHVQMFAIGITGITSQCWSGAISFVSYLKVVRNKPDEYLEKVYKYFHIAMGILVLIITLIITVFGTPTKKDTYWCWCSQMRITMMMYIFYWILMISCLIFYILTVIELRKVFKKILKIQFKVSKEKQMTQFRIQLRMSMIPLIYIITLIPATIKRFKEEFDSNSKSSTAINILQAIGTTTHGFWDFLIFVVFVGEMRRKITRCYKKEHIIEDDPKVSTIQEIPLSNDSGGELEPLMEQIIK
ncbi:g protein-coupled receptor [Anaeramoeba ignava]|uniref:G protein-coupled receptor n=1 Tax=Anaeramoeba ignava TaxID=1746090 RepID=A0A9Q0L8S9_ANAIG|nr:g protein-coupled receptor [Anaeramoeba ignava]